MKKVSMYGLVGVIVSVSLFFGLSTTTFASSYYDVLNNNDQQAVVTNDITGDPLRQ
jgi:hypothetical protein